MNKKGFTLVELLAVIVILAVILAIAVPKITSIVDTSKRNSFEASTKMLLKAIQMKLLENSSFDISTINKGNLESLLNIDSDNYSKVSVKYDSNNKPYVSIEGAANWGGYTAYGNFNTLTVESTLVANGLLLYLDAANSFSYSGTGTAWNDLSGNGRNAILYNSPSYVNGTISLDGVDDYIEVTNATDLIQGKTQFTMGLWFKLDDVSLPLRGLIGTGNYGCQSNLILTASNNSLTFYNDDTNCRSISWNLPLLVNQWIFAVARYDGTNSVVGGSQNGSALSYNSAVLKTGATNVFSSNFRVMAPNHTYRTSGDVSMAFVYDRYLSNSEIESIYLATKSRFGL